tara:strand:+ start:837 stop:1121 length:285 start_codon:yes stop_codon:yes gene_type:complete
MSKYIGTLLGLIFASSLFFIPYISNSQYSQVLIVTGILAFIIIVFTIFIISNKFGGLNKFIDNQELINQKNKEKFKIYERLIELEKGVELIKSK